MRAYIVIDLGFGDAGKGLITDLLVRQKQAGVVVRYNGGAQAGHNVVTSDGRHHTFSQFGSGSFVPGVKTYLSEHMVVHPGALLIEGDQLIAKGESDIFSRIRINENALIVTPYHQAANRIRESVREDARHGSCGVGIGETVEDSLSNPEASVKARDLKHPLRLRDKLKTIRESKQKQFVEQYGIKQLQGPLFAEWKYFLQKDLADAWIRSIERIQNYGLITSAEGLHEWSSQTDCMVFEGAQGALLDANAGFYPYNSWSRCAADDAIDIAKCTDPQCEIVKIGVTRCYMVRHGPGPLPSETRALDGIISEHNQDNPWQGKVRYGWFDKILCNYALQILNGVDALAITHLDILQKLDAWQYCSHYDSEPDLRSFSSLPLEQKENLTRQLISVKPFFEQVNANDAEVIEKIVQLCNIQTGIVSHGPSNRDATFKRSI